MQHLQQQLSTARESHATQQRMLQDANGELLDVWEWEGGVFCAC